MASLSVRIVAAAIALCVGRSIATQQPQPSRLHLQTPSFVFARYASGSASALYAARGLGPVGGFVAMVQNPETQYRELIAGPFTQVNWRGNSVLLAIAYADASESQYVQTYIAPSFSTDALAVSGTLEWYEPLGHAGTRQFSVNPASLQLRVSSRLWVGAAYTLGLEERLAPRHRGGPVVEWAMRRGTLRVELLDRTVGESMEIRAAILAAF